MSKHPKIGLVSLGCPKNTVDSEVMIGHLDQRGAALTPDVDDADVLIVNTCSFIDEAKQESIDAILDAVRRKTDGHCRRVVVAGCMVQRYGEELARELPEVDAFVDLDSLDSVAAAAGLSGMPMPRRLSSLPRLPTAPPPPVHEPTPATYLYDADTPRRLVTPPWMAYVKIAEGCDNTCAFCAIPRFRGAFRSRPLEDIRNEVEALAARGVREVNLIAQDSTAYGADLGIADGPARLMETLSGVEALRWVRLFYVYPNKISDRLLEVMGSRPRIARYIDIPLQHASRDVLARMRRGGSADGHLRLLERIRSHIAGVSVRTTFIVGFPGETDADFAELVDFVRAARFDNLGVFTYSHEEHTPAGELEDDVPADVKHERQRQLMAEQEAISRELQEARVGRTFTVLCEGSCRETEHLLEGRLEGQAPEVDGRVLINDGEARPGEFVQVEITEAHPHDLVGRVVAAA